MLEYLRIRRHYNDERDRETELSYERALLNNQNML